MDPNIDLIDLGDGVDLSNLMPLTKLLVWTSHSLYRFVVGVDDLYVEGGTYFPSRTSADSVGARLGRHSVKAGWIWVGLSMEILVGDRYVVTSPVHGIVAEPPGASTVH